MFETKLFVSHFIAARVKSDKIMIVLHGRGDSIKPFRGFDKELNMKNMNYLLIQAPRKFDDGFSWYGEPPFKKEGVLKIRSKVFELLEDLQSAGWKAENIFLFGFSQGCLVSSDVALNYPKKLGGVVGISGYFHFFPRWKTRLTEDSKKTPWLFTHGRRDDVLDIKDTKYGVEKLKWACLNVDWIETNKKHVLEDREMPWIRKWLEERV